MTRNPRSAKAAGSRFEQLAKCTLTCDNETKGPGERANAPRPWPDWLESNVDKNSLQPGIPAVVTCDECGEPRLLMAGKPGRMCRSCAAKIGSAAAAARKRPSPMERLLVRVQKASNGCWLWQGPLQVNGYGQIWVKSAGRKIETHRLAYQLFKGEIPFGMNIDHLCRVRHCCNPDHLEVVTSKVNTYRGIGPASVNAVKTHCAHGHAYTFENTYVEVTRKGRRKRHCVICRSEQQKARRA
jgi:hypothetical protein